ncbi:MAG: flavodoxin family protein [Actinomycetota bacterium]
MGKVLLVSASPRKKGNTAQLVEECARVIAENGTETEVVSLAGMEIRSCLACGKCAELGECVQDDGLNSILARVKEADGFVVGTPVYFGTARGDLMSALQRIGMVSKSTDNFLSRKVGGPIAVARRGGHTATIQELLMFYLINDMIVPGSYYWNMVFGRDAGEVWDDEEGILVVRRFAENVAWLVNTIAARAAG